jgi:hypothetical protein
MRHLRLILLACATLLQFMQPAFSDVPLSTPMHVRAAVTQAAREDVGKCHEMQAKKTSAAAQARQRHSNCCDSADHCDCAGGASAALPACCFMTINTVATHSVNRAGSDGKTVRAQMNRLRPPIIFLS